MSEPTQPDPIPGATDDPEQPTNPPPADEAPAGGGVDISVPPSPGEAVSQEQIERSGLEE